MKINPAHKKIAVIIASLLVASGFSACSRASSGDDTKKESPLPSKATPAAPKPAALPQARALAVKGLSIGMKIDDCVGILKKELTGYEMPFPFSGAPKFTEIEPSDGGFLLRLGHRKQDTQFPMFFAFVTVVADSDRRITRVDFTASVVDHIFGATEMDAKEFAQNFVNAYPVKQLKPLEDGSGWYGVTQDGTRVTITSEKELRLQKVRSASEQKSKFN